MAGKLNTLIGSPIERLEDFRFLKGAGQYVDDVFRDNALHAAILRSATAHGRIRSIDTDGALALPGVHAVITAENFGGDVPTIPMRQEATPDLKRFEQPVIATGKVRYAGEPLAVVLAESAAVAEDALEHILLDIEELPSVRSAHVAPPSDAVLFESIGTNLATTFTATRGDIAAAFAQPDYVRRERFKVGRHTAVPMEARGLLAEWNEAGTKLTVFGAVKVPFHNRRVLADHFKIAVDDIRMVENDVGGGFGVRGEYYPEDFLIPYAARHALRPVKWIEDRREHLTATNHARDAECELEIACTREGKILGLRGTATVDIGAYIRPVGATAARNLAQVLSGPYSVPHIQIEVSLLVSNKTPAATYRGPGRFEADFFRERLFDIASRDLGLDRVAFRRRNLISEAEMPYPLATVPSLNLASECDSGDYQITLDRCLSESRWHEKAALSGRLIEGRYQGLGIGCYIEGGGSGPRENARLVLENDGTISVFVGSSAVGQGLETVFTQIAADALGLSLASIRGVFHGSTDNVHEGFGSYSSRSVVMGGSAIVAAAGKLVDAIRAAAAGRLGGVPEQIVLTDGRAVAADGAFIALADLAAENLAAEGTFASHKRTYSYGTHAAHVAVDPNTGHVQLIDYVALEDVGRIINPHTLHGQTLGGIVQGLGGALLEDLVYDDNAQLLTGSLADYLLPTATDFPVIRAIALELKPSPNNPLGAKGAGEGGVIPVGGVIANAVADALSSLGVEPRELPLSPCRVWSLINGRQN
jgi:carbon-monoxide dehydrogenase large subunit